MELNKYKEFLDKKEEILEDWNDFDFVLSQVKQDGYALQFASGRLQDNEDIVREAVKQNGLALCYASERLKDNEDIVKIAVKQNGWALRYASERLQDNEEIVREAVKQDGLALQFASYNLQKEFIKKQPELIEYVNQTPELVKIAIDSGLKERNKNIIKISQEEFENYLKTLKNHNK
jgi:hypothetical protein